MSVAAEIKGVKWIPGGEKKSLNFKMATRKEQYSLLRYDFYYGKKMGFSGTFMLHCIGKSLKFKAK